MDTTGNDSDQRRAALHVILDRLATRLAALLACEAHKAADWTQIPTWTTAVYLLSEDGRPIYVGRTRTLRRRLRQHVSTTSGRDSATFAFRLAKVDAARAGVAVKRTRKTLEADANFQQFFDAAKGRVAAMDVRYIVVDDPVEQALLEVYAAESLATPYNTFETH